LAVSRADIQDMSVSERLDLIEMIWSTLSDDSDVLEISVATRRELGRRLAEYRRDPDATEAWEVVRDRLDALD
jgi:putative addiction module component (TIGR02574 family)